MFGVLYHRTYTSPPESFLNDINKGQCELNNFVCFVFDEAHRASGTFHLNAELLRVALIDFPSSYSQEIMPIVESAPHLWKPNPTVAS